MKAFLATLLRTLLFVVYISYFIITLFVNFGYLEQSLKPLSALHLSRVVCFNNNRVCLGSYPEDPIIKKIRPKTVVTLLNPKIPFSRELVKAEMKRLTPQGIKVISIPIPLFKSDSNNYDNIMALIHNPDIKTPIYIHAYLFDRRLKQIEHRLIMEDKSAK